MNDVLRPSFQPGRLLTGLSALAAAVLFASPALAQAAAPLVPNKGDTAFMLSLIHI